MHAGAGQHRQGRAEAALDVVVAVGIDRDQQQRRVRAGGGCRLGGGEGAYGWRGGATGDQCSCGTEQQAKQEFHTWSLTMLRGRRHDSPRLMTNSHLARCRRLAAALVVTAFAGSVGAQQAPPPPRPVPLARPVVLPAPAQVQYQQVVRQQQAMDRLQQSQLEQQLHSSVSRNANRPNAADPKAQQQLNQSEQAQLQRDQARQQALLDSYRQAPVCRAWCRKTCPGRRMTPAEH